MKAVYIEKHGGVDALTCGDLPEPDVGPNDVKVRVRATSVNRLDLFTRAGVKGTRVALSGPHILGGDTAGDVVETGSAVTGLAPGDRVVINPRLTCGRCAQCAGGSDELCSSSGRIGSTTAGSYAEYVSVPAVNAVPLPDSVSYEQGASLPTVFMPSWSLLLRKADLKPWETALVLSASSGVGTAAIQVAKNVVGATVIATTSTDEKARMATELGADAVVNYTTEDVTTRVRNLTGGRGADVVLDHVGADAWPTATAALAPGGRYGICGVTSGYRAELQMGTLFLKQQTILGVFMGRSGDLSHIVQMAERGVIRGVIHKTYPLQEAAKAHEDMEAQTFFGKLVLIVP
jgi:NADPH:quinone reductase-like Zn-dependent oxidoreductase